MIQDDPEPSTSRARLLAAPNMSSHRARHRIGPLSLVFFGWLLPLLCTAQHKQLSEEDLLPLWWRDNVARNAAAATRLWAERRGSFKHVFYKTCGGQFILAGAFRILSDACSLGQPLLMRLFLRDFVQDPNAPWWLGAAYGGGLVVGSIGSGIFDVASRFIGTRLAIRVETILKTLMFRKALSLSCASRGAFGVGDVLTRMSVDVERVAGLVPWLHYSYSPFIMLAVAMTMLVRQVRVSLVFGLAVVALLMPLAAVVIWISYRLEDRLMKRRDERTKLMSEILRAAKGIKATGLAGPLTRRVHEVRDKELVTLRSTQWLGGLQGFFWSAMPSLLSTAVFASYTLLPPHLTCGSAPAGLAHCPITPAIAFSTLLLLRMLHEPLMVMPYMISELLNAAVSLRRIRRLLLADDAPRLTAASDGAACGGEDAGSPSTGSVAPLLVASERTDGGSSAAPGVVLALQRASFSWHSATKLAGGEDAEPTEEDGEDGEEGKAKVTGGGESGGGEDSGDGSGGGSGGGRGGGSGSGGDSGGGGDGLVAVASPSAATSPSTPEADAPSVADARSATSALAAPTSLPPLTDGRALDTVSLQVSEGELVAVVGEVGSGKTALLLALLGELVRTDEALAEDAVADTTSAADARGAPLPPPASRVCNVRLEVAYAPQEAVIASGTVRENILYGRRFDAARYAAVLHACALETDLAQLAAGDQTRVGEKGVTLSGGQRQRVALARACYSPAPIVLLDDPLSAVDRAVAHHLFRHVLRGWLRHRTVVCVTHALAFVGGFDRVVVMQNGRLTLTGTVAQIAAQGLDLDALVAGAAPALATADAADAPPAAEPVGGPVASIDEECDVNVDLDATEKLARTGPVALAGDVEDEAAIAGAEDEKEEDEEERAAGAVKCSVLAHYVSGAGGVLVALPFVLGFLIEMVLERGGDVWLGLWSSGKLATQVNATQAEELQPLYIYLGFSLGSAGASMVLLLVAAQVTWRASKALHTRLLDVVMGARQAFFDTTPVGRILNRFTRDTNIIDEQVGWTLYSSFTEVLGLCSMLGVLVLITRVFALAALPLMLLFVQIGRTYRPAGRELERIVAVRTSPLFQLFTEALHGAPLIRAAQLSHVHERRYTRALARAEVAHFNQAAVSRWLDQWIQLLGSGMVALVVAFAVVTRATAAGEPGSGEGSGGYDGVDEAAPAGSAADGRWLWGVDRVIVGVTGGDSDGSPTSGLIGLALSYGLGIAFALQGTLRVVLQLELHLVSVERNLQYCVDIPQEEPMSMRMLSATGREGLTHRAKRASREHAVPVGDSWPEAGRVHFVAVELRYRPDLPPALRGVSFAVGAGERMGIVGRSGSGKSSLVSALLRLVELDGGRIEIDGVDHRHVPLCRLRTSIAVVMQDAVMFSGDLRYNLDPTEMHSDEELADSLRRVRLCTEEEDAAEKLRETVGEGGENWSAGQRQLICLARAILSSARVMVCDEATSSIDSETDAVVQSVLRSRPATMLVIAHRLETILDSDRVLVVDSGALAEEGPPAELAAKPGGRFAALLAARGSASSPTGVT